VAYPPLATLQTNPDIELRILAAESLANFQTDGVDIAVRQGRPPFGTGLVADQLFEQEVVAVCSPALLASRKLRSGDLDRLTLLSDAHNLWPEFIEHALGRSRSHAGKQVGFNQTSLAIDAAIAGQGLALASRFLVEADINAQRLSQAFTPTMRGGMDYYVVTLRKPRHAAPTAAVRQWLLAHRDRGSS
jgi:LysR family transcriptional regulator, glycine cleavage system transcriptional activator